MGMGVANFRDVSRGIFMRMGGPQRCYCFSEEGHGDSDHWESSSWSHIETVSVRLIRVPPYHGETKKC